MAKSNKTNKTNIPATTPVDVEINGHTETAPQSVQPAAVQLAAGAAQPSPEGQPEKIIVDSQGLTHGGAIARFAFALLYLADNVRTEATYQIPKMVASLLRHGFKANHPLVLSRKADGRALVLCGNRRTKALQWIAENQPTDFARILPDGEIPAVIYDNLTAEQEALLRIDHGTDEDRVPLDEFGEFLAIRQLVRAGYLSESGIAEKMGKFREDKQTGKLVANRSWVQPRVALAQLPQYVQDEFRKLWTEGNAATPLRVGNILKLYKVFNEEYRNFPNGDGPQFKALYAEMMGTVHVVKTAKVVITPSIALERSKHMGSRILRETLKIVAGEAADNPDTAAPFNLGDIDGMLQVAEAAQATLAEIADYLGEDAYNDLVGKARKAADDKIAESKAAAGSTDSNGTEENLSNRELQEITA